MGEEQGGGGLAPRDVFELLALCRTYAVPVPLAETMVASAACRAGGQPPAGSIALAHGNGGGRGRPAVRKCGRVADWALVQRPTECLLLPAADAQASPAMFPLGVTLEWGSTAVAAARHFPGAHDVQVQQACVTAANLAGALMNARCGMRTGGSSSGARSASFRQSSTN